MKAKTTRKDLHKALGQVARVAPKKSHIPLFSCLKMEAETGWLHLSATNSDMDLRVSVSAEVDEPWECTVPAHLLADHIRYADGEYAELELYGSELLVESDGAKARVQTAEDASAFPAIDFASLADAEDYPAAPVAQAFDNVRYAVDPGAFQAVFRGVQLEAREETTLFVASDGYRVALEQASTGLPAGGEWIVPRRSVDTILKLLGAAENVRMSAGDGQLHFKTEGATLNVKLLDGKYPEWEQIVPTDFQLIVSVNAALLKGAFERANVFAQGSANNRLKLSIQGGQLGLESESDFGSTHEVLEADVSGPAAGEEFRVEFNAAFLADVVGPITGDIKLQFADKLKPVVAAGEGQSYKGLLVPLRV